MAQRLLRRCPRLGDLPFLEQDFGLLQMTPDGGKTRDGTAIQRDDEPKTVDVAQD